MRPEDRFNKVKLHYTICFMDNHPDIEFDRTFYLKDIVDLNVHVEVATDITRGGYVYADEDGTTKVFPAHRIALVEISKSAA